MSSVQRNVKRTVIPWSYFFVAIGLFGAIADAVFQASAPYRSDLVLITSLGDIIIVAIGLFGIFLGKALLQLDERITNLEKNR